MSNSSTFQWIISSKDLAPSNISQKEIFAKAKDAESHLLILKTDQLRELAQSDVQSSLVYTELPVSRSPKSGAGPAKLLIVVGLTPKPEEVDDVNVWYDEEHVPMLSQVPGWCKTVRLKGIDDKQEGPRFLALHFYEAENGAGISKSAEFKAAVTTPWCAKIIGACKSNGHPHGYARWEWDLEYYQ